MYVYKAKCLASPPEYIKIKNTSHDNFFDTHEHDY
jgi:hypothetical protein